MKTLFCDITTVSDEEFADRFSMMSEERKDRCRRMRQPEDQKRCIAADSLIRTAVSEVLNISPKAVVYSVADSGKPYIKENPFYFSVSHSEDMVVCCCSPAPIGVDIEKHRSVLVSAQERICTEEEWDYLNAAGTEEERNLRFFTLWTRKEAIFKLDGILPRKDKEIPALHPETLGISVKTEQMGQYTLSVAELML